MALIGVIVAQLAYRYLRVQTRVAETTQIVDRVIDGAVRGIEWVEDAVKIVADYAGNIDVSWLALE